MDSEIHTPGIPQTWPEVVLAYPSDKFQMDLAVTPQQRSNMIKRGRIPPGYWPTLQEKAALRGVPLPPGTLEACEIHYQITRADEKVQPPLPLSGGSPGCHGPGCHGPVSVGAGQGTAAGDGGGQ